MVRLPDRRLFLAMRTNRGEVWYSVSDAEGVTWHAPAPMRYRDGGDLLRQPASPCALFGLQRGDILLLGNDNDGSAHGAEHIWDVRNRRPAFLYRGEFRPGAAQPIWWSQPRLFIDNDAIPWGPQGLGRLEAAAYCSLTEVAGERILWYPDRKGFLLGRRIEDGWLEELHVPSPGG